MFMKNKKQDKLLRLMMAILVLSTAVGAQNNISFAGIVVDDEGNPIENARVSLLYPPCETCDDQVIPTYITNKEGYFFLDGINLRSKKVEVFIEGNIPNGLWNPVFPVDLRLKLFPEFQGSVFDISGSRKTFQLENVSPNVNYKAVSVDLLRLFDVDSDYLKNSSSLNINIESKGISVTNNLLVHERAIDRIENNVNFTLPKGVWVLTFSISNDNEIRVGKVLVNLVTEAGDIYEYQNKISE